MLSASTGLGRPHAAKVALIWSVVLWTLRRHHVRVSDKEPPPEETA